MTTNVKNKVVEVRAWMARVQQDGGEVGTADVKAFVYRRWPELDVDIREDIVAEATKE